MADLVGKTLGRYQILELLGQGGMATVYKADDTLLERDVAVKVIRRDAFPAEILDVILKRFEREAKTLAKISHPNIVQVIDYGEYEGDPYLVMVYLPGGTLKDRMGQPIPWQEAVRFLVPVARALEFAHEHNIINRDVKPSNILLTEKGLPMLTDFGLVKLFESKEGTNLTSSGVGMGTPDYMAPEQWTGEALPQSDIYSLGVVLYEMITNHRPYTADTPAGVLLKQARDPLPPPRNFVSDLPREVDLILQKALEKEPQHRYRSMEEFGDALENLIAGISRPVDPMLRSTVKVQRPSASVIQAAMEAQQTPSMTPSQPVAPAPGSYPATPAASGSKSWIGLAIGAFAAILFIAAILFWWISANLNPPMTPSAVQPTPANSATESSAVPTKTTKSTSAPSGVPTIATNLPPATTVNSLPSEMKDDKGVTMRLVDAGPFTMGNDRAEADDAKPASEVTLDAYYIDENEVTNAQYKKCVEDGSCRQPKQGGSATHSSYFSHPDFADYPVLNVDWRMANVYCMWRGARLPTEAEWEKAARGTDGRIYPWGNGLVDCSLANYSGCENDTSPIGMHNGGKSVYGVLDLAGNVWEWTGSLYRSYPYDLNDGREDLNATGSRVARGGSWHSSFGGNSARSDVRLSLDPTYYGLYVGFRCALTP